jgi:hypothetical protein
MSIKGRIPKSLNDKLLDLDQHVYLLRQNLKSLEEDISHLKQISSELRTLICYSSETEGLLWRLVNELQIDDSVFLHLAGKLNQDHPLARDITFCVVLIERGGLGHPQLKPDKYSFKDVIKNYEAVFIKGESIKHENLIKALAEQMGSAHEDDGIVPSLVHLKSILINGKNPYEPILRIDAELTIEICERVIEHAEMYNNYNRICHGESFGNISLVLKIRIMQQLISKIPILIFRSFISNIVIECSASPLGLNYKIEKQGNIIKELFAPYSNDSNTGDVSVFILSYCSKRKISRIITNNIAQKPEPISDLGWIFPEDISIEDISNNNYFIKNIFAIVYNRLLSTEDSIGLLENSSDLFVNENTSNIDENICNNYEFPE